ncbi:MAG: bifunctional UDP-N-acetylglucosamine diphosphorylase/glucosamine-1-phosphate N-acetyltransferase GlmU [Phenylobacterium sp.]|uniref:bifunctional UDP-N-acetylglucosamine diphosphorylase/glucosamine-1-phosphate N-acetyltransferase GlmU n=1 Tax=Phenylobacterium sp. TaxID=1871053 RepID=UPI0017AEB617|nr:bifunctional UDP-N-acetylglucosamine diphosphorylase/glucosamine-1-phosphate N-acetyltransferase GlmU [Phenylobacterium sp.]MBA4793875.1 bifunctional UDP-N-acetylglucosamine diphosphorylase/glucosamine-1-phosphate N-acetyltransferase GlmU [Phenylobacterium sp.]
MTERAAVILAAGQGTRMKSPLPKVLHKVGGRTMLDRAIDAVQAAGCEKVVVVVGAHETGAQVRAAAVARLGENAIAVQDPPLGTGHAVLAAQGALAAFHGDVLVTNADCPLLEGRDLEPLFELRQKGATLALLGFEPADPALYGRLIRGADGHVIRIVEARDASQEERNVRACYSGMMVADRDRLFGWLAKVGNDNAKGEYYLTEVVAHAVAEEAQVRAVFAPETAVMGADSQAQLSAAEAIFQQRRRAHFLGAGVAMPAPDTVHFSWDTQIEPGATVEQFVVFAPGVKVATGAVIRAFSHLEGASVAEGALVGPYARLRPGAEIGPQAHIGNFVEVKKVKVGEGAKANHLTYLGDGTVGAGANIGAGTIFCNYDGFDKHETHVGEGAFIGSNTALVAPVRVGAGAYTGSGSVITRDVEPDALALERAVQAEKPGWAARFRAAKMAKKSKAKG